MKYIIENCSVSYGGNPQFLHRLEFDSDGKDFTTWSNYRECNPPLQFHLHKAMALVNKLNCLRGRRKEFKIHVFE